MSDDASEYLAFAERLRAGGVIADPWINGRPRFRLAPVVLSRSEQRALYEAAEDVARIYNELCLLFYGEPQWLDGFLRLSPFQKVMWHSSAPLWHGLARADVFMRADGTLTVCELNADTPSGEAEAVVLNALAMQGATGLEDPNVGLEEAYCRMLQRMTLGLTSVRPGAPISVGIVYPTELTEDLSMVALYQRWFEARGWRVELGSPYNLVTAPDGRASLFGTPCDLVVRHYKTDWWGERIPVWNDAVGYPDYEPLIGSLEIVLASALNGHTAIANPFGSVVPQNKRAMAFMWEKRELFTPWAQEAIARLIPETRRLEGFKRTVWEQKDAWVLKSDYGCEGSEVIVGAACTEEDWQLTVKNAAPGRWVAQRYFEPKAQPDGTSVNYGVYLVAGEAAGLYSRMQHGATDADAESAATLVTRE
jgi:glutathionylspermidine synthase